MDTPLTFTLDRQQWKPQRSKPLRLIKRVFTDPLPPGTRLLLFGRGRRALEEEVVHPGHTFPLAIGFWIPWPQKALWLRIAKPDGALSVHRVDVEGRAAPATPLTPMADLQKYLTRRETAADVWPGVKRIDVARYLRRHAIVYEKPATHWTEGLYLGSGQTGGVVTGSLDGEFHFGLGDARIWLADHEDKPLGPGYAADLKLKYPASGEFRQVLDIGEAIVRTTHGPLTIDCWIDRETSVAYVELTSTKPMTVEATLSRQPLPLGGTLPSVVHGSWSRIFPQEKLAEFRKQAGESSKAPIDVRAKDSVGSLTVSAPNMSIRTTVRAGRSAAEARNGQVTVSVRLKKNQTQRLILAVDVVSQNAPSIITGAPGVVSGIDPSCDWRTRCRNRCTTTASTMSRRRSPATPLRGSSA